MTKKIRVRLAEEYTYGDTMKTRREILVLDFDGVIHAYTTPWKNARTIPDEPVPGAARFILDAMHHFDIAVSSSRSHQWGGRGAMRAYIGKVLHHEAVEHLMEAWLPRKVREVFDHNPMEPAEHIDWLLGGLLRYPLFKPPAKVTIDDRAITFVGDWPDPKTLLHFKPWKVPGPPFLLDPGFVGGGIIKAVDEAIASVSGNRESAVFEVAGDNLASLRFDTRQVPIPSSFEGGPGARERRMFLQQWVWFPTPDQGPRRGKWVDVLGQDKGFPVK